MYLTGYAVYCNGTCGAKLGVTGRLCEAYEWTPYFETEAEAIAAWNTRTGELSGVLEALPMTKENMAEYGWVRERTCTNASYRLDESRFHCSECGFGCWVKNVATGRDELPQHCPNCGAKVVEP